MLVTEIANKVKEGKLLYLHGSYNFINGNYILLGTDSTIALLLKLPPDTNFLVEEHTNSLQLDLTSIT